MALLRIIPVLLAAACALASSFAVLADEPPVVPVGLDAYRMWVPVGFEKSFQMAYSRTRYGTGYYIYHQFVPGTKLSRPIRAWDGKTPPDRDMLELISKAGSDLAAGVSTDGVLGAVDVPA